jgi:uncharacterized protein (DUF1800 family)
MQEQMRRESQPSLSTADLTAPTIPPQTSESPQLDDDIHIKGKAISRRHLIGNVGATAAAAVVIHSLARPEASTAQDKTVQPAMRSPLNQVTASAGGPPELPSLGVIVLNRMGFGPRPGDLEAFDALASTPETRLETYVAQQLNPAAIDDSACDAIIAGFQFQTLGKSLIELWADHVRAEGIDWGERTRPAWETEWVTFLKAVYSKRQLVEVLADHWHNHFNIYGHDYWTAPVWVQYDRDVIRANSFGNFREMVQAVAQSPAMLYYLDNQSNSGGNPNENFARELFELHTLGAENYFGVKPLLIDPNGNFEHPAPKDANDQPLMYVDDDVYGATTCFTGWQADSETGLFQFNTASHFPYQKLVLGRLLPAGQGFKDGQDVLDLICRHSGTARHISRKLCRRLISDTPPESIVQAAAGVFMANLDAPDQLKQVVQTILLSAEFRTTWGEKIKRPFEYTVSILRASEADFTPENDSFRWMYSNMGQPLFSWHPPNGYPDFKIAWSSTMPMLQRWRMANWLIAWQYGGEGANKEEFRLKFTNPESLATPIAIVDYWSQRLLGRLLPEHERSLVIDFMAYGRDPQNGLPPNQIEERLRYMVALLFLSPSFQWR